MGGGEVTEMLMLVVPVPIEFVPVIVNMVRLKRTDGVPERFPVEELKNKPWGRAGEMVKPLVTVVVMLPYLRLPLVLSWYEK